MYSDPHRQFEFLKKIGFVRICGTQEELTAAQMIMEDKKLIASVTICGVVDSYIWQGKVVHCH